LTDDANHFVLRNNYIIDLAPLQIYISALLFAPSFSTVRQVFGDSLKSLFVTMPRVPAHWGAEKQILEGHESGVTRAVCSTDGRRIVSSGYDHCVRVWDVVTGEQCKVFVGHSDWVSAVDLSADGETVASVADDETVRLWSVTSGQERAKLDIGMMAEQRHDVRTDEPCIGAVAFSPDNSTLATACYDTTVQLWDPKTGKVQRTLEGHTEWVRSIAFSNNGEVIATGAGDGIRLWNVSEGKEIRTLKGSLTGCISVVKISPDGEMLASGSEDGCIRFWNMKTGEFINRLDEHTDHDCTIEDLAFSPDGRILASTCHDHAVSLWDIATREGISRLRGHEDIVNSVAFLPDGKAVVTASDDATVRLWDISANIELHKTEAHSEAVSAVAFSRNGRLLASAANMDEFGVRLWDTASGAQMLKIACFELSANVIIFSPDGNTVTLLWDNDVKGEWAITRDNGTQLLRASSIRRKAHKSYHHELVDNNPSQNSDDHCESAYQEGSSGSQHKMTVVTSWIRRNDEDFIWLPFEYRAVCYSTFGASIAIGRASGAITILSLL
jgi:WD40 repeat protein